MTTMQADIYTIKGTQDGSVALPENVFGLPWNADLVHQVVVAMEANARTPIAHTKNRAEVSGTGRKPWKQKGTGSARHGSRRSPIWRTGGVAHGPRNEKDYSQKINKKMRVKALYTALSRKFKDGEILFVKDLSFDAPKAKDAKNVIGALSGIKGFEQLSTKRKNAALIAVPAKDQNVALSFRNFGNVAVEEVRNLSPIDVLSAKFIIIADPSESMKVIEARGAKKKAAAAQ